MSSDQQTQSATSNQDAGGVANITTTTPKPASRFSTPVRWPTPLGGVGSAFGRLSAPGTTIPDVSGFVVPGGESPSDASRSQSASDVPRNQSAYLSTAGTNAFSQHVGGTSAPAYHPFSAEDSTDPTCLRQYDSITAIPAYQDSSFEELRVQDYGDYRKAETTGAFGTFGQQKTTTPTTSSPRLIEDLVKMSFFGQELVDTQFYLLSAKSSTCGLITTPRIIRANNALLATSSNYFLKLLNSNMTSLDPGVVELTGDDEVPNDTWLDDYGYESDSDLDDDDPIPAARPTSREDGSATPSTCRSQWNDDSLSETGSSSISSDISIKSEQTREDEILLIRKDEPPSRVTSGNKMLGKHVATQPTKRNRRFFVGGTAFRTWYTLLYYLYTDKVNFLPLKSATPRRRRHLNDSLTNFLDEPGCSAKSMYRLASSIGLDRLRKEALTHIWRNLSEHNIIKELSCGLVAKYPELLEMELDVLYSHIASPPVLTGFADLARRIANKDIPHGADIMIGIHARIVNEPHRFKPAARADESGGAGRSS